MAEEVKKDDWEIDELYRKAWQIVKTNKMLWVLGLAAGSGMSFRNSADFDGSEWESLQKIFNGAPQNSQELSRVLGDATSASDAFFGYLFSALNPLFYIVFFAELLLLILGVVLISYIYQAWISGMLFTAIDDCINGGKVVLSTASEKAFLRLKALLWINIVPGLLFVLAILIGVILFTSLLFYGPTAIKIVTGIASFLGILFLIYATVILSFTLIFAPRIIMVESKSGKEAFTSALRIARKKKWAMLLLGIVNSVMTGVVYAVPLIVLAGVFLAMAASSLIPAIAPAQVYFLGLAFILVLPFILAFTILSGFVEAFKAVVWSLAYHAIKGKYDN